MADRTGMGRRAFVAGLGLGGAVIGAARVEAAAIEGAWQAAHEPKDAWMDLPGLHRMVFDATSDNGAGDAMDFCDTYYDFNLSGYGLKPEALGTIIILRHFATVFGYNDVIWKKYGHTLAKHVKPEALVIAAEGGRNPFDDPAQKDLANGGVTLSQLASKGVHFAICGAASQKIAEMIAKDVNAKAADIHGELTANLVTHGHLVPAGIVALNRAQERGFALAQMN